MIKWFKSLFKSTTYFDSNYDFYGEDGTYIEFPEITEGMKIMVCDKLFIAGKKKKILEECDLCGDHEIEVIEMTDSD